MNRKRIFLSGGSGFVGGNILESFLNDKYEIISPSRRELDLADTGQVDAFFKKHKFDVVIHSAGRPGHRNAPNTSGIFYSNTRMFFNLARHSEDLERLIFLGSGAVYDLANSEPRMVEDFFGTHIPVDEYGFSKYVCGKHIENSLNMVDLRIFGIFGKREDYEIRFISNMICKCIFGLPLTMNQDRRFDFLYVQDLPLVLDYFIQNRPRHRAYNVTPDETVSLSDMAKRILAISGKDLPITAKIPGLGREYSGDNSRLKGEFADYRTTAFEDSIRELYQWYEANAGLIKKQAFLSDK